MSNPTQSPIQVASDGKTSSNRGSVVSVRGSVVDVKFEKNLPPIFSVLRAGADKQIVIEVLTQSDKQHVRGIALTPTQGLARGMMGEVVGMAASVCKEYNTLPRGVYQEHLDDLKKLMQRGTGKKTFADAKQ